MKRIKCFFAKPTTKVRRYFRRYETGNCPGKFDYHNAKILRDEINVPVSQGRHETDRRMIHQPPAKYLRRRFPKKCDSCDFIFTEASQFQLFNERLYINEESNELYELRRLPPGAMYYADWMLHKNSNLFRGPDGHSLIVILPNGNPWTVDGPCSNCTKPDDKTHKCWVRTGEPPLITVGKNGNTCSAGAGSIQSGNYHGFLRNGYLEEC